LHYPDGPEQRERDEAMRAAMAAELEGRPIPDGNPNQWADRTKSCRQFDYDAYAQVEQWWTDGGRARVEALGRGGDTAPDDSEVTTSKTRL
jgi:salicylate hydroxylase